MLLLWSDWSECVDYLPIAAALTIDLAVWQITGLYLIHSFEFSRLLGFFLTDMKLLKDKQPSVALTRASHHLFIHKTSLVCFPDLIFL